jgi:gamma-butyrobetaine dioxygenase
MVGPDAAVILHSDALEVHWSSGRVSHLPYLWLRDNCQCEDCRVRQTSEKRFMISDVPVDIEPRAASLEGDDLIILWPDGHKTSYSDVGMDALHARGVSSWTPWQRDFTPARCPFQVFLDDDATAASTIADFLDKGAVILEQAPTAPGTLESLAPRLGPIREVLFARIHDVYVHDSGYNVAHTPIALPPHNDFASYSWPPSVQALHMLENEAGGGESVIVDGWRVLTQLREEHPQHFQSLCDVPVPFREFDDDNETYTVAPIVRCDADGEIASLRFSNQLMQTMDPEMHGVGDFYRAYHTLCTMVSDDASKARFRLDGGDILIVAAHRVLHGRDAFDSSGRRHLQDAYFELDNVRNHVVVLGRKGVNSHD